MKLKSELYKEQQLQLSQKIVDILELNDKNQIILYYLDRDVEKISKIMNLVPELRKYFSFSRIAGLESPEIYKRPYLSIIRQITKLTHTLIVKNKELLLNKKRIRTRILILQKLENI